MVIQLGSVQRFVVSVRKDVSYRGKKVGLQKKTGYERSTMIDKAMIPRKRLITFLQNRAFKFNYKKLLVPLTLQKGFYKIKEKQ